MHGITALLVFSTTPFQAMEKPVLLARFTPAGLLTLRQRLAPEPVIAVWADGRAIWREPSPVLIKEGDNYSYSAGNFYEARIDPARIRGLLEELHADKAFALKTWSPPILDAGGVRIRILSRGEELNLMWLPNVRTGRPGDPKLAERWERGTKALNQVASFIAEVKKAPAKEIERPDPDQFDPPDS